MSADLLLEAAERFLLGESLVGLTPDLARGYVATLGADAFGARRRGIAARVIAGLDTAALRAATVGPERVELVACFEALHGPHTTASDCYFDLVQARQRRDVGRLGCTLAYLANNASWRTVEALHGLCAVVHAIELECERPSSIGVLRAA